MIDSREKRLANKASTTLQFNYFLKTVFLVGINSGRFFNLVK